MVRTKFEDVKAAKEQLLIPIDKKWWQLRPDLSAIKIKSALNSDEESFRQEAEYLLEMDRKKYLAYKQAAEKSDFNWITSVIKSGTFTDRLSANTLLIQDSPIHNLHSLHKLIDIVDSKGIRECLMSMENLKELFLGDLLLKDKKLKPFSELIGFLHNKEGDQRNRQLVIFYFEDKLLSEYRRFLEILAKVSMEGNDAVKSKAVNVMYELLSERPEQEQFLLEKLVNKLGDPIPKRAAHVANLLVKLVNLKHPKMKEIVVKEVEQILFRQHISELAQFHGLCFLSQVLLEHRDKDLASRMINIYFNFFDASTKKEEVKNKMMNVLITGVSRAMPYANMKPELLEKRLESFYKVIHLVNQNTSVQGMVLIFNLMDSKDSGLISDRLYTMLYRSLLDINMETCSRRALYLNLLFKAMKRDPVPHRVIAFIKRLLQISLYQPPSIVCGILVLISSIIKVKPELQGTLKPVEVSKILTENDEDEHYEDIEIDDDDEEDNKSKKSKSHKGESLKEKSKLSKKKKDKAMKAAKVDSMETNGVEKEKGKLNTPVTWMHNKNLKNEQNSTFYDISARNPIYANAKYCINWELTLLQNHYHPSASLFANKMLEGESISYDGDPLEDFTLKRFMDRFVFRNPKQISKQKAAQAAKSTVFARLNKSKVTPIQELANAPKSNVPLEEQFIYDYLVQKKKEAEENEQFKDNESVSSVDFERLLLKFEPDINDDTDFMNISRKKDKKKKGKRDAEGEESSGTEDSLSDDDFDMDSDDEFYREAFDDVDEDLAEVEFAGDETFLSDKDEESEDGEDMDTSKFKRRGRDKNMVNLFAAADKFAHLLEGKESDEENKNGSDDDDDDDDSNNRRNKRNKRRMPKRKPNQKFKKRR